MEAKLDVSQVFTVIQAVNIVLAIAVLAAFVLFLRRLIIRNRKK